MINILPVTIFSKGTADKLVLKVLDFDMTATTAIFYYALVDTISPSNNSFITLLDGNIEMTESEFANWGADNQYCINWAASKLGVIIINN